MAYDRSADLILFAGWQADEAYVAFGASPAFRDDPIVIVPWSHDSAPGRPLAWWHCPDWEALLVSLRRAGNPALREALVRASIAAGGPAWSACRNAGAGPRLGTPNNPILAATAGSLTAGG